MFNFNWKKDTEHKVTPFVQETCTKPGQFDPEEIVIDEQADPEMTFFQAYCCPGKCFGAGHKSILPETKEKKT